MSNENIQSNLIKLADSIFNSDLPKETKLLRLWGIIELDYRGIAGEHAHKYFLCLMDPETSNFIFQLVGYLSNGIPSMDKLIDLVTGNKTTEQIEIEEIIKKGLQETK